MSTDLIKENQAKMTPDDFLEISHGEIQEKRKILRESLELARKTHITVHLQFQGSQLNSDGTVGNGSFLFYLDQNTKRTAVEFMAALEIYLEECAARGI